MAIPVGEYESLAQQVLEVYNEAELTMIRRVARRLLKGVNAPGWAERKLSETAQVHRQLSELFAALTKREDYIGHAGNGLCRRTEMVLCGCESICAIHRHFAYCAEQRKGSRYLVRSQQATGCGRPKDSPPMR